MEKLDENLTNLISGGNFGDDYPKKCNCKICGKEFYVRIPNGLMEPDSHSLDPDHKKITKYCPRHYKRKYKSTFNPRYLYAHLDQQD